MATDDKQKAAERLIDEFAARLLALNDGKGIPRRWKTRLLKAIVPPPAKHGKKRDIARAIEIVKRLVLEGDKLGLEYTKGRESKSAIMERIGRDTGRSRKHVANIDRLDWLDGSLNPEDKTIVAEGMVAVIGELLRAGVEAETLGSTRRPFESNGKRKAEAGRADRQSERQARGTVAP